MKTVGVFDSGVGGLSVLQALLAEMPSAQFVYAADSGHAPYGERTAEQVCQRTHLTGAIVVSTPQDVALLDARKALDMFTKMKTPVLGLVENMSTYICPNCGHEAHIFGHGGVAAEARKQSLPFLGEIPLDLSVRIAGDAGTPIAAGDGPIAEAYAALAKRLIAGGMA